jgi:hypothetical protein
MNLKGFTKLSIQIAVLSVSMIALSFLTDTDLWLEHFNNHTSIHNYTFCPEEGVTHTHWNYRGWVYVLSGTAFFIMSVAKIIMSHKNEDFHQTK